MKPYSLSLFTIFITLHVGACDSDDSKKDEGASGGNAGSVATGTAGSGDIAVGGSRQLGGNGGLGGVTTAASTASAGTSVGGTSITRAGAAGASQLATAGATQSGAAGAAAAATWLDVATGRTWQVDVKENVTFAEAAAYCDALVLEGSVDWRLPTIDELRTIISGCAATTKNGTCGVKDNCLDSTLCRDDSCGGCVAIPDGCYLVPRLAGICGFVWSSATQSNYADNAWGVGFNGAHVSADLKLNAGSARYVR